MSIAKERKAAKEMLQAASKVYHYRRDLLPEVRLADLDRAVNELNQLYRDKSTDADRLVAAMERLDALLRKIGGKIYPKTFWSDNLEVALVAAIIVIGVRTFFFQPFIIPTNSMYPTYSGMNAVVYEDKNEAPPAFSKAIRFLTLGARHKALIARNSGTVEFEGVRMVPGKKWFVLPTTLKEFTFTVGGVRHAIRVPPDFDMWSTINQSFPRSQVIQGPNGIGRFDLNTQVNAGEAILRFDITLGDALFVDRISYHFKRPEAGDPFVFRTREIPGIEGGPQDFVDKYYIKRIGGIGGETLRIDNGTLLVNEKPRDEVPAFERNAQLEGEYKGYVYPNSNARFPPKLLTDEESSAKIPEGSFVALGDNSANSLDSRYWGFVPENSVVGKAIFIYYPFTKRWGLAE